MARNVTISHPPSSSSDDGMDVGYTALVVAESRDVQCPPEYLEDVENVLNCNVAPIAGQVPVDFYGT